MDEALIKKLFQTAWQKYYYNLQVDRPNKVQYYTGQCNLLLENFGQYLSDTEELQRIKDKAEANALEDLEFYN